MYSSNYVGWAEENTVCTYKVSYQLASFPRDQITFQQNNIVGMLIFSVSNYSNDVTHISEQWETNTGVICLWEGINSKVCWKVVSDYKNVWGSCQKNPAYLPWGLQRANFIVPVNFNGVNGVLIHLLYTYSTLAETECHFMKLYFIQSSTVWVDREARLVGGSMQGVRIILLSLCQSILIKSVCVPSLSQGNKRTYTHTRRHTPPD